jgi:predicted molibdopterin-dependent oxidoreductase YjgC
VELNPADAQKYGITEGDTVRVESPRGAIEVPARIGQVMAGAVFAPFHYGAFDLDHLDPRAPAVGRGSGQANELTMTVWDPVSKQPYFKTAACRISKVSSGHRSSRAPTTAASAPADTNSVASTGGGQPTITRLVPTPAYPNDPAQGTASPPPTATAERRS